MYWLHISCKPDGVPESILWIFAFPPFLNDSDCSKEFSDPAPFKFQICYVSLQMSILVQLIDSNVCLERHKSFLEEKKKKLLCNLGIA